MTTPSIERELLDLETQYWEAIRDKNVDVAIRLSHDPCIVAGAQGVGRLHKDELAAMMKKASYKLERFELGDDAEVSLISDDVAVVAYNVHEELTVDGRPVTIDAADSSTWIRRDGRWVCAQHSEALAGDPFGRDRAAPSVAISDEHAIRALFDALIGASQADDLEKTLSLMADDVRFLVPGHQPFGKDAFAVQARRLKGTRMQAQVDVEQLEVAGDWAWCRTYLTVSTADWTRSGYTLSILRKNADGAWVLAQDANLLGT